MKAGTVPWEVSGSTLCQGPHSLFSSLLPAWPWRMTTLDTPTEGLHKPTASSLLPPAGPSLSLGPAFK